MASILEKSLYAKNVRKCDEKQTDKKTPTWLIHQGQIYFGDLSNIIVQVTAYTHTVNSCTHKNTGSFNCNAKTNKIKLRISE